MHDEPAPVLLAEGDLPYEPELERNMKFLATTLVMIAAASPCLAMSTLISTQLSCPTIHAEVNRQGAVLLRYRSKNPAAIVIYDRVVSDPEKCKGSGFGERSYFPSADGKPCAVWTCAASTDLRP